MMDRLENKRKIWIRGEFNILYNNIVPTNATGDAFMLHFELLSSLELLLSCASINLHQHIPPTSSSSLLTGTRFSVHKVVELSFQVRHFIPENLPPLPQLVAYVYTVALPLVRLWIHFLFVHLQMKTGRKVECHCGLFSFRRRNGKCKEGPDAGVCLNPDAKHTKKLF